MPVVLETVRLQLRPMEWTDGPALLGIFGDPRVMAAFQEPPFDEVRLQAWMQRNLEHQARHGYGLFSVIEKASGQLIGDCGLEWMQVDGQPAAELGYDFRCDRWNLGLATEAARAVRDYALQELHLPRLVSLIRVGNTASRRVAEKIGMHCAGEFQRHGIAYWHLTWPAAEGSTE